MKISIIIPIYNALDDVKKCLESVLKINFNLCNVILVNDCSDDITTDFLKNFVKQNNKHFQLLENEENLGFPKTCNRGMKACNADVLVLLNSDTIIPKKFCEKVLSCFYSDNKIGIASPLRTNGGQYSLDLPQNWSIEKMNKYICKKHKPQYPIIPSAEGLCFCIRKEVIEQQGYLDEIYGKGYHEEVDFAYRANTNGWKNVLIDNLFIYHKMHASFGAEQRKKLIEQNNAIFHERWSGHREQFIKMHNWKNPSIQIKEKLFPQKEKIKYTLLQYIFSVKNNRRNTHKIITILGLKLKFKKGNSNE